MEKLIVENRSNLDLKDAIILIKSVLDEGKISNEGKQHCYLTTFTFKGDKFSVHSILNKKSERLVITAE